MPTRRSATLGAALSAVVVVGLAAPAAAERPDDRFDLQAHRGGTGLYTESTRESFANALELGVTTLELDTQVTEDGAVVVTHDRQINGDKCRDTAPAFAGDLEYPYVGKYITDLTLAQVQTVECGYQPLPQHPEQQIAPGPMLELGDVFDLVRYYRANQVTLNIETKVEAAAPEETAPREEFVRAVVDEVEAHKMERQVTIQSFDWGALELVGELNPRLPRVALTNYDFLEVGQPGASVWLGGLDADDFGGDLVAMAEQLGVEAISPVHGFPQDGTVADDDYTPYVTAKMVDDAHAAGIEVIPWTVDDPDTMRRLIETGIDGLITDRPDRLRDVMDECDLRLPKQYTAPHGSIL
ncbi:glycerophosphodiester phosphodiesterase family protein [Georgenia halophila]|uniref:Glycerophosphodiester phosphodiesterase family protein n=1 Tax=Georgenia halophila TaxID=620889 RepID=A0ABP8LIR1_9MICO